MLSWIKSFDLFYPLKTFKLDDFLVYKIKLSKFKWVKLNWFYGNLHISLCKKSHWDGNKCMIGVQKCNKNFNQFDQSFDRKVKLTLKSYWLHYIAERSGNVFLSRHTGLIIAQLAEWAALIESSALCWFLQI